MQTTPCQQLTELAATIAGVSHARVFSRDRTLRVCHVRYAVWHILYSSGSYSLPDIARAAGYSSHGAILNGLRQAKQLLATSPSFVRLVSALSKLEL
jgi:chromosomal replication initiation ATPase DnaA